MNLGSDTYFEDAPSVSPQFDFDLIGTSLAKVLQQEASGAMVVGLHGPWGCGKTTLMYAIRDALLKEDPAPIVVDFNAWKYQSREALWRALILRLVGELRRRSGDSEELDELESSLYRAFEVQEAGPWSINWRNAATEVASVALEVLQLGVLGRFLRSVFGRRAKKDGEPLIGADDIERISGALERQTVSRHLAQVQSIEQFLGVFRNLVAKLNEKGQKIVVLIDDLDRCLPDSALEVFEAIKLFLDAPGCGFVVAVDREVIRNGLAIRYASSEGALAGTQVASADEYIEKTIAISYDVPQLSGADVDTLIDEARLPLEIDEEQKLLIQTALSSNPRRVKRFVNLLKLQIDLAGRLAEREQAVPLPLRGRGDKESLTVLIKTMLIGYRFSLLLQRGESDSLFAFQRVVTQYEDTIDRDPTKARAEREKGLQELPAKISALKEDGALWSLLALEPILDEEHKDEVVSYLNWFRRTGVETDQEPVDDA